MEADKRKKCFHPYIRAMTPMVERWLCKKAAEGWKLYEKNGWMFTFLSAKGQERDYFIYSSFGLEKGLSYDYFRAKDRYAKAKSHINQTNNGIFEANPVKIDGAYYKYKADRDRYYRRNYLWQLLPVILFVLVLSFICSITNNAFVLCLLLMFVLLLGYDVLSLLLLTTQKTRLK